MLPQNLRRYEVKRLFTVTEYTSLQGTEGSVMNSKFETHHKYYLGTYSNIRPDLNANREMLSNIDIIRVMHHKYVKSHEQLQPLDRFGLHQILQISQFRDFNFRLPSCRVVAEEVGPWKSRLQVASLSNECAFSRFCPDSPFLSWNTYRLPKPELHLDRGYSSPTLRKMEPVCYSISQIPD